ncbi:hypothetical protein B1181_10405 [Enterococcus faecium]|nr:hypothetical protein B1181_10405 [Enterococcus faecium]
MVHSDSDLILHNSSVLIDKEPKRMSHSLIPNKRCGRDSLSVVIRHISFTASFLRKNRFIRKIPRIHLLHVDLD